MARNQKENLNVEFETILATFCKLFEGAAKQQASFEFSEKIFIDLIIFQLMT